MAISTTTAISPISVSTNLDTTLTANDNENTNSNDTNINNTNSNNNAGNNKAVEDNADFSDGINALEAALSQIDSLVKEQQEKENINKNRKNSVSDAEKTMKQLEMEQANPFRRGSGGCDQSCDW